MTLVTARSTSQWLDFPTSVLQAELLRRQDTAERPACGSGTSSRRYNTPLHVFALFLILILSTLACSFPVIVRRFPKLPVPNYALFLSRHFGTGVLIATAFVHLLPTAYVSLTDACLPRFWNEVYPAMAGFIAMLSVMTVVSIEMFFAMKGATHSHESDFASMPRSERRPANNRTGSFRPFSHGLPRPDAGTAEYVQLKERTEEYEDSPRDTGPMSKPLPRPPSLDEDDSDLDMDELDPIPDESGLLNGHSKHKGKRPANGHLHPPGNTDRASFQSEVSDLSMPLPDAHNEQRQVLQCLLLEAGILFHSVFIGMALSVSTGPAFIVLLIAISFHQTFEGLALGSRIAAIQSFSTGSPKPWLMSLMYGITTPIGQAIGLAVHGLYDPASQVGLLMVGIVNAISSGLLLYAGLVQLLAEDFLSDQSYIDLTGRRRLEACAAVFGGSMLMALVGAWA